MTKGQRGCVTPPDRYAVLSLLEGVEFEDRSGELGQGPRRITYLWPGRTGTEYVLVHFSFQNPVVFAVSSDGDVADLYRRVRGKEHPTLKGELSEGYKAFLER